MGIEELKNILADQKRNISDEFKVKELGIFGSYVRGEQKKDSDLDLLVEFDAAPGLLKFISLERYLSGLLGVKVDLVRKKAIRPELKETILKEAISLW